MKSLRDGESCAYFSRGVCAFAVQSVLLCVFRFLRVCVCVFMAKRRGQPSRVKPGPRAYSRVHTDRKRTHTCASTRGQGPTGKQGHSLQRAVLTGICPVLAVTGHPLLARRSARSQEAGGDGDLGPGPSPWQGQELSGDTRGSGQDWTPGRRGRSAGTGHPEALASTPPSP